MRPSPSGKSEIEQDHRGLDAPDRVHRLGDRARLDDRVTVTGERGAQEPPQLQIIVDDQDGAHGAASLTGKIESSSTVRALRRRVIRRELDAKPRARARDVVDADVPTMRLDDRADDREAEPRAGRIRRAHELVEQRRAELGRDAATVVDDVER